MALRLVIGGTPISPQYEFERRDIKSRSLQVVTSVDVVGSELAADELYADVDYMVGEYVWFSPKDYYGVKTSDGYIFATADQTIDLTQVPFATPVWLMDGENVRYRLYFDNAERIDPRAYRLTMISGVGLLERKRHKGNYYASATVAEVLEDIIGDTFGYTVDENAASQRVSGLLLPDTARHNLHLLMFAMGISLVKDVDGGIRFEFLTQTDEYTIPASRIFLGGSISYQTPVTAVEVTEHTYYEFDDMEAVMLFDNTAKPAVDHVLVEFDSAYHDLATTGTLTINETGKTYAIITGIGVLTGVPYYHDARIVHLDNPAPDGGEDVVKCENDYLINGLNSISVAKRMLAYYTSPQLVQLPVRVDGEKAGGKVTYADPFGDGDQTGYIVGVDSVVTGFEKATLKIVKDYTPTGQGNNHTSHALITSSGTWTVPAGVTAIRIAVIGGGTGGDGGYDGEIGAGDIQDSEFPGDMREYVGVDDIIYYQDQPVKHGGAGGTPGNPGKIYVIDAAVSPGEVLTVSPGIGGAGGARNGGIGGEGTATTVSSISLGSLSSELGIVTAAGFVDVFTGLAYGASGRTGYAGGDGGQTDTFGLSGDNGYDGRQGGNVVNWHGGAGGAGERQNTGAGITPITASGGGGGGAAYGHNGGAGGRGTWTADQRLVVTGGSGGKGADADAPPQAVYGCGGNGGNGGGAGGNAGGGCLANIVLDRDWIAPGDRGQGGLGSSGGAGGDGCVVIYY